MKKEIDAQCSACGGTGLYSGMAESKDLAVVCSRCEGSGKMLVTYTPFTSRKKRRGIKRVIATSTGYKLNAELVGQYGLSYKDWENGKLFTRGTEVRNFSCPGSWYQSADYDRKPNWDECASPGYSWSECKHYGTKEKCWERWDREQGDSKTT
jgi:hypothetical protein